MTGDVVVLGGGGLLGSAVCRAFARVGRTVRAVSRSGHAPDGVEPVRADVTRRPELEAALAGAGTVVLAVAHRARGARGWRVAEGTSERGVYVDVCADVARWARDAGRAVVVHAGTTTQGTGTTAYDAMKNRGEQHVLAARGPEVHALGLRLSTLYGDHPGAAGVVATMASAAMRGEPLHVWHAGRMTRDLLWSEDAAAAVVAAEQHAATLSGASWVVGHGTAWAVADVASTLTREIAATTGRPEVPVLSVPAPAWAEAGDLQDVRVDPSPFRRITGWRASTPWPEGARRLVAALLPTAPLLDPP